MRYRRVAFFLICVAVGFSAVAQTRSTNGMNLFVSKKTVTDMEVSIESERAELLGIEKRREEARRKLAEYEQIAANEDLDFRETLLAEMKLYRAVTAATALRGPGVVVTLDDSAEDVPEWVDANAFLVHDTDILRILSDLNKGGAEAISINGHRIYSNSTVFCNGYSVRVNGEPEARPFIIKAIGDPAKLSAAMIGAGSYGSLLKEYYGLVYRVEVETDIEIEAHTRRVTFRYAQKVEGGA